MANARSGFKKAAEELALEVRKEINLSEFDRLDPRLLAEHYGIPVVELAELLEDGAKTESISQLTVVTESEFSAMTIFDGPARLIVVNTAHTGGRQSNSTAHELAHMLLEHEPQQSIIVGGCRKWNAKMEDEADWLAGELLVPRIAALDIVRRRTPVRLAAQAYGVSHKLMSWRLNHSGARIQVARETAARRRRSR